MVELDEDGGVKPAFFNDFDQWAAVRVWPKRMYDMNVDFIRTDYEKLPPDSIVRRVITSRY